MENKNEKTTDIKEEVVDNVAEVKTSDSTVEDTKAKKVDDKSLPDFNVGDVVIVNYRISEGEKTRIQPYEGLVIAIKGAEVSKTFTVRRIGVANIGVERIFPMHSPNIESLEIKTKGKVRRSKLYYLRDRVGKAALKVREQKVAK